MRRVFEVFSEQGGGLHDGGQRVADFMGHGSRHAPHGGQLLGAQAGLHLPQVVQKHHAQALFFGGGVFLVADVSQVCACRPTGLWPSASRLTSATCDCPWRKTPARQQHQGCQ